MRSIQERLLKRESSSLNASQGSNKIERKERRDSTASPQTAGMSKHKALELLEVILYPGTSIHNMLEEYLMMEFFEFWVETSLPRLHFRLGVPLLRSKRRELYEERLTKNTFRNVILYPNIPVWH